MQLSETKTFQILFFLVLGALMLLSIEAYLRMVESDTNGPQVIEELFVD